LQSKLFQEKEQFLNSFKKLDKEASHLKVENAELEKQVQEKRSRFEELCDGNMLAQMQRNSFKKQ